MNDHENSEAKVQPNENAGRPSTYSVLSAYRSLGPKATQTFLVLVDGLLVGGAKRIDRLTLFRKLEFLAPHKAIEVFLDRSASYFARDQPTTLTASVSWRTSEGERRRATIVHDLEIYRDLGYIEREVPERGRPA